MRRFFATLLLTATAFVPAIAADPASEKPEVGTFGFDEAGMDRSVKPGDDFFLYANGGWIRDTPIPNDKPLWGSYMQLRDLSSQRLRGILEGDPASKIGRAYASYMDNARVEQLGFAPIRPWLARIKAVKDRRAFTAPLADAAQMGVQAAFTDYAWEDDKRPQLETLTVEQGGIGMPDRDIYLANANYSQLFISFPAAFLQPPIFDPNADPAVNYGAIGAVAGHEISHNFDNNGSLYNEKGELSTWWKPEDLAAFKAASQALVSLYDSYEPLPGEHVRGQFTLTENIGDLGGLSVAYDAYKRSLGGKPAPVINGLTGDQRFLLGWAQFYRIKEREAYARQALLTDSHSPAAQRTWAVRNIDAWYDAFGVRPGDKLYLPPEKRIRIW